MNCGTVTVRVQIITYCIIISVHVTCIPAVEKVMNRFPSI